MKKNLYSIITTYLRSFSKKISIFYILLPVLFLLLPLTLRSNALSENLFVTLNCKNNICKCQSTENFSIDSVLHYLKYYNNKDTAILACAYHQLAVKHYIYDNLAKAIQNSHKAIKLRTQFDDGWLWKSQLNLANFYNYENQYEESIKYAEMAKDQVGNPKRPKDSLLIFRLLTDGYKEIGENEKAIQYAKKAIYVNAKKEKIRDALFIYTKVLVSTKDSSNLKIAIEYLDSLENIYYNLKDTINLPVIKTQLGKAFYFNQQKNKSVKYYIEALKLFKYDTLNKAILSNNIGSTFTELGKLELAHKYLIQSLNTNKTYYKNDFHYIYATNYENLGDYFAKKNQLDSALTNYQKALNNLTNNFRSNDVFQNPNSKEKDQFIYSNPDMIRVLHLKATAALQFYQQNNKPKYLNLANETYQILINFHNKLQKEISTENSRLFQAKNVLEYLEQALEVAFTKQANSSFDVDAAFRLMEKNKATVLLQSMNEADALQFANLPDSLLEQEKDLKIAITYYERQLNDAIIYEDTITVIKQLENTLLESKEKYHRLIKTLEENYPDYYHLKYQQNESTLAEVQNRLNQNTALLEYFVGSKHIYVLSIQQHQSKLYKFEKPNDWGKRIYDFVGIFKRPDLSSNLHSSTQVKQFSNQAFYFYETLLQQPLAELEESVSHLQIIPDAELNYLPFEVLLYQQPDTTTSTLSFNELPYLIKNKAIGYAYSANLWLDDLETEPLNNPVTYGGYASKHQIDETYDDLPKPREQIKQTAELFKGVSYVAGLATKSAFMEDDNSYQISHFAMHGIVNDTLPLNSHLVFTPNNSKDFKLYASDLYNKKLNTELAVLNACNTGTGQLQKGEGVMSLSRAFTYAGCPSLVMSLWSIPDVSSAKVLDDFFINLKDGLTKDVALQKAKLNFLETSEKAHPVYWAGLVAVGNLEALHFKSDKQLSLIVLATVLFLTGGFLVMKKALS